jgi:hypothetical protein
MIMRHFTEVDLNPFHEFKDHLDKFMSNHVELIDLAPSTDIFDDLAMALIKAIYEEEDA